MRVEEKIKEVIEEQKQYESFYEHMLEGLVKKNIKGYKNLIEKCDNLSNILYKMLECVSDEELRTLIARIINIRVNFFARCSEFSSDAMLRLVKKGIADLRICIINEPPEFRYLTKNPFKNHVFLLVGDGAIPKMNGNDSYLKNILTRGIFEGKVMLFDPTIRKYFEFKRGKNLKENIATNFGPEVLYDFTKKSYIEAPCYINFDSKKIDKILNQYIKKLTTEYPHLLRDVQELTFAYRVKKRAIEFNRFFPKQRPDDIKIPPIKIPSPPLLGELLSSQYYTWDDLFGNSNPWENRF